MSRYFVTATDTGVGKTEVAAALLSLMAERGLRPAAFKPYESGVSERPADAVRLWEAAGKVDPLEHVVLRTFKTPVAPGVAAIRERKQTSLSEAVAGFRRFAGRALVMEGAGGLFVPLSAQHDVVDVIAATKLPVILVARAGLGTINHTLLSLAELDRRRIPVRAVVLVKSTAAKDVSERDNAEWISRRRDVEILGPVPYLADQKRRAAATKKVLRPLLQADLD